MNVDIYNTRKNQLETIYIDHDDAVEKRITLAKIRLASKRKASIAQRKKNNKYVQKELTTVITKQQNKLLLTKKATDTVKKIGMIVLGSTAALWGIITLLKKINDSEGVYPEGYIGYDGRYDENVSNPIEAKRNQVKNKIIAEAESQGVDPALALAIAMNESGFDHYWTSGSRKGRLKRPYEDEQLMLQGKLSKDKVAVGIFQIKPSTAKGMGYSNVEDEDQNIKAGIKYIKYLIGKFGDKDYRRIATAYNAGPYAGYNPNKLSDYAINVNESSKKFRKELEAMSTTPSPQKLHLSNVNAHKFNKNVIISDVARNYLNEVNGSDIVTSGMDGRHGTSGSEILHPTGLKIDVVPTKNHSSTYADWAATAIPYIMHKDTAYINFEDFTDTEFNRIKQIIFANIPPTYQQKCNKKHHWYFGETHTFLFRTGKNRLTTGKHLDIGILPARYRNGRTYSYTENNNANTNATKGNGVTKPSTNSTSKSNSNSNSSTRKLYPVGYTEKGKPIINIQKSSF